MKPINVDLREEVIRVKEIENAILSISKSMGAIEKGRLTGEAIVILIKAMVPKTVKTNDIRYVLASLPKLADTYLRKDDE